MATRLLLRRTAENAIGNYFDMKTARGTTSFTTGVVNTTASGTQIQWTRTAGGTVLEWISGKAPVGGFTLAGTVTFNIWALESNMAANAGGRSRLFKRTAAGVETEVAGGPWNDGVEFGTSSAAMNWTGTPTSTAFSEDDRLIVRYYITNVGTMGGSQTCTIDYDHSTAAVDGDSWVELTETVTFKDTIAVTSGTVAGIVQDAFETNDSGAPTGQTGAVGEGEIFTVGQNCNLWAIALNLAKVGAPTDNVYLEVTSVSISGTVLATSDTVAGTSLTTSPVWTSFNFPTRPSLTTGTSYYWRFLRSGALDSTNLYSPWRWQFDGHTSYWYDGTTWQTAPDSHRNYRIISDSESLYLPTVALTYKSLLSWPLPRPRIYTRRRI